MDQLSDDILFHILAKLSAKNLVKLRYVCKQWCQIIDDPHLAELNLESAKEELGIMLLSFPACSTPNITSRTWNDYGNFWEDANLYSSDIFPIRPVIVSMTIYTNSSTGINEDERPNGETTSHHLSLLPVFPAITTTTNTQNILSNSWNEDGRFWEITPYDLPHEIELDECNLESHCNGILCFSREINRDWRAYLVNPCRQEILKLPSHDIRMTRSRNLKSRNLKRRYGLGFDSASRTYKVVCVSGNRPFGSGKLSAEIYTLGSKSSWRALDQDPIPRLAGFKLFYDDLEEKVIYADEERPIYAGGVLYWVQGDKPKLSEIHVLPPKTNDDYKIVSFHLGKEKFRLISHPNNNRCHLFHLVELKGVLGFVDCSSHTHIKIWMMKDYDREIWVENCIIKILDPASNCLSHNELEVIGLWENDELVVRYWNSFLSYNPNTQISRYIHVPLRYAQYKYDSIELFSFIGSLVSLSGFKVKKTT